MMLVTPKVNRVNLNRGADLSFWGENVVVPFGNFAAKALSEVLDTLGAETIVVEYRTIADPKARARDEAKFTKRLAALGPQWTRSPWTNQVIDGFVFPDVMACTLTRIG